MGVVAMRASWPASPLSAYAERGTGGEAPGALEPDQGTMVDRFSFGEVRMIDLSRVRGALWLAPGADPKAIALAVETGPAAPGGAQPAAGPRVGLDGGLVGGAGGGWERTPLESSHPV